MLFGNVVRAAAIALRQPHGQKLPRALPLGFIPGSETAASLFSSGVPSASDNGASNPTKEEHPHQGTPEIAKTISDGAAKSPQEQQQQQGEHGSMQTISIDRSGLISGPQHLSGEPTDANAATKKEEETEMAAHIKALIQFRGGPITMAEFMKEALTNPIGGFYMTRDVIGSAGDFVTSPEISQVFGELVGIWSVCTWQQMGCPEKLRIVELGPGKGTLMADLLRGTKAFAPFSSAVEVHMVEVGTELRKLQRETLMCGDEELPDQQEEKEQKEGEEGDGGQHGAGATALVSGISGAPVTWHRSLAEVPSEAGVPAIYIAHEFLDALPVHQFQRTPARGWAERLVDVASPDSPLHMRFVLSPHPTPAMKLLLERRLRFLGADATKYDEMEVSALVMSAASDLAERVSREGGAAMLIDYGQDQPYGTSVQGIREHRIVPVLEAPGKVDLSAWVDFSSVRQAVAEAEQGSSNSQGAAVHGPVTQAHLLRSLGIDARMSALMEAASPDQAKQLQEAYTRLVGSSDDVDGLEDGMGKTYKAMVIAHKDLPVPVAFEEVDDDDAAADKSGGGDDDGPSGPGSGEEIPGDGSQHHGGASSTGQGPGN